MNNYDIGDKVRSTGTFVNSSDVNTDPTTITFKLKDPSGNITTFIYLTDAEVVKSGTGVYYFDNILDEEGVYHYRFEGTGVLVASGEDSYRAVTSEFY